MGDVMLNDMELLREYAAEGLETSFRTVLDRHVALVYSAALRQVRDPHLAEEVTQAVFVVLARKAGSLHKNTILAGWLFRTTRFITSRAMRDERRRQHREREAAHMETVHASVTPDTSWEEIAPTLDEALTQLGEKDRNAILLRFFEKRDLKEVGSALHSSEDAAQKRIARALEKLRSFFSRRGVALSTVALAGALTQNAVHAAPAGLSTVALASVNAGAAAPVTLALVKAALNGLIYAKVQAIGLGIGILLTITAGGIVVADKLSPKRLPPEAYTSLGFIYLHQQRQYSNAIATFQLCIREYPRYSDGYHGLAQAQREAGDPATALENHNRAIQLNPARHDLYWERGVTYLRLKNDDAAITDFEACLARKSEFASAYFGLGEAYRNKGDFQTALIHQNRGLALKPGSSAFYRERGYTYEKMGDKQSAATDFAKARELELK